MRMAESDHTRALTLLLPRHLSTYVWRIVNFPRISDSPHTGGIARPKSDDRCSASGLAREICDSTQAAVGVAREFRPLARRASHTPIAMQAGAESVTRTSRVAVAGSS